MRIEVIKGRLFWHWRIVSKNNKIVVSSETYLRKAGAIKMATKLSYITGYEVVIK